MSIIGWLADEADKVPKLKPVIEAAQEKDSNIKIVVSALALAEVLWLKNAPRLGKEKGRKIKDFFKHEYVVVVDVDTRTAELARELVWDYGVRPKDAIHVATAILRKAEQLDTFDDELIKLSGKIGNPGLVIGHPNIHEQMKLWDKLPEKKPAERLKEEGDEEPEPDI